MGKHLRKLFSVDHVKEVFQRYLSREIAVDQALAMLKIRRRQFFKLLKFYREKPESFSLDYTRKAPPRKIDAKAEAKITQELKKETEIIRDKRNPVRFYNYQLCERDPGEETQSASVFADDHPSDEKMGITNRSQLARPITGRS